MAVRAQRLLVGGRIEWGNCPSCGQAIRIIFASTEVGRLRCPSCREPLHDDETGFPEWFDLGEPEGECGKCGATITADDVDWLSVEEDEELKGMDTGVCPRCSQKVISVDEEEDLVEVDGEVFAPVTWYRQGEAQGGTASE